MRGEFKSIQSRQFTTNLCLYAFHEIRAQVFILEERSTVPVQQHACQREPRVLLLQVDAYDFEGVGELAVEERILMSGEHVDLPCAHDS